MSIDVLKRAGLFIAYVLVQAMVPISSDLLPRCFMSISWSNSHATTLNGESFYGVSRLDWLSTSSATLLGWQQEL